MGFTLNLTLFFRLHVNVLLLRLVVTLCLIGFELCYFCVSVCLK